MFDSIRKHQRWLQFVLLILILPAFVFFGISGYEGMLSADRGIAKVGAVEISQAEFDAAQRQQLEQMRQMLGDTVDAKVFDTPEVRARILDNLIAQKTIATRAEESLVIVTDRRVQQTLLGIEALKGPDGGFDRARYEQLVLSRGQTTAGFEAMVRADLRLQTLPDAVQASAFFPKTVRDRLIALQEQTHEIRERRFPAADFAAKVQPTDEQLTAYYDANGARFETPETAKVDYVLLSRDAFAAQIVIPPEDLKRHYEQNKTRFGSAEERRASHILIKASPDAPAKADKLLAAVKADPSKFESIAKASSDDPGSAAQGGDLGFFERGMMVKPFADAAFAMKEGEIRGPVESEFGLHLIRLVAIKPATIKPFEAVRDEIERELRGLQAGAKYAEAAQKFTDLVYEQSESLGPVAEMWKLEVRSGDLVGRGPAADMPKDSPLANARLVSALFTDDVLRGKRNTEAIEIAPGRIAAARIVEYKAPQRLALAEVRDEVRKRVIAEAAAGLAKAAGEAMLAQLKAGEGETAGFSSAKTVSRASPAGLAPQALDAVLRLPAGAEPAYAGVDLGAEGYTIVQRLKVTPPSDEALARLRVGYDAQFERVAAQQDLVSYIEALKGRTKIVRHPERIGAASPQ
jgi:peptidyl-prolyl cis-trans isomerase D